MLRVCHFALPDEIEMHRNAGHQPVASVLRNQITAPLGIASVENWYDIDLVAGSDELDRYRIGFPGDLRWFEVGKGSLKPFRQPVDEIADLMGCGI